VPDLDSLLADLISGDESRAESALPGLIALGTQALPALLKAGRSEEADHRWWVVRALAESPEATSEHLLAFLQDPAPEVRQAAALGLSAHLSEGAIPELVRSLYDPDSMVGSLASQALVKTGAACVPSLIQVLSDAPQGTRILALRALVELKDHRAIPAMMKVIQEDSAVLGHWAQEGLERLGLNMVYIKPT